MNRPWAVAAFALGLLAAAIAYLLDWLLFFSDASKALTLAKRWAGS